MSIATKPKSANHSKQVRGAHHRHSKNYLKTYWPYIPIIGIIIIGIAVNHFWKVNNHQNAQLSSFTFIEALESSIGLLALSIFLLRHAFAWHRVLVKSEAFASKHPVVDICLVTIAVAGILLASKGISII